MSGPTSRRSVVALVDQGLVSATSFGTTILVGRLAGEAALGVYALGVSAALLASAAQDSLVMVPYTFFRERDEAGARAHAGAAFLHNAAISAASVVVALALAAAFGDAPGRPWLRPTMLALAVTIPLYLLRDFARRLAYAHHEVRAAVALDAAVAALLFAALARLAATDRLDGPSALLALGVASGLPAAAWLLAIRSRFDPRAAWSRAVLARYWPFGRLDLAARGVGVVQGYTPHWGLALLRLPDATGVLSACEMVARIANPIVLGVNNVYMPRLADARRDGMEEVWRVVRKTALLFAVALAPTTLLLVGFGGPVVGAVYGPEFAGHGPAVAILAFAAVLWAGETVALNGLRALDRPRAYLASGMAGLVVTGAAVVVLVGGAAGEGREATVLAAAWSVLAGSAAVTGLQWTFLIRGIRRGRAGSR